MTLFASESRRLVVFAALMAVVAPAAPAWAVLNGTPVTDPYAFPCMVSIQRFGSHSCGGTLIDASHVLTSASCVDGANVSTLTVAAGGVDRSQPFQQVVAVDSYSINPVYNTGTTTYANNIAIVTLSTPMMLVGAIQTCRLAQYTWAPDPGTQCTVVGWGRTNSSNLLPNLLQQGTMDVISVVEANQRFQSVVGASVDDYQLPLFDPAEQVIFSSGDSGGPVFCPDGSGNQTVSGIMSWVIYDRYSETLASYPGVATLVGPYQQYIIDGSFPTGSYSSQCPNVYYVGAACDDGNPCTSGETCDATLNCTGGSPVADGTICNDNNACTWGDSCMSGKCKPSQTNTCEQCPPGTGFCNPSTGLCACFTSVDGFSQECSHETEFGCLDPSSSSSYSYSGGTAGSLGKWATGDKCNNDDQIGGLHEYGLVNAPHPSTIDQGSDDIEGIVSGGFPDDGRTFGCVGGSCAYPHLSNVDNPCDHHDRDFNVELVPTTDSTRNWRRWAPLAAANLIGPVGDGPGATRGGIVGEVEWEYFFPTWPSCQAAGLNCSNPNAAGGLAQTLIVYPGEETGNAIVGGGRPTPLLSPVLSNSGDTGNLGVPWRQDEIVVRGRHTYDCGHSWGEHDADQFSIHGHDGYTDYPVSNNRQCQVSADCTGIDGCGGPTCVSDSSPPTYTNVSVDSSGRLFCQTGTFEAFGGVACTCEQNVCQLQRSMAAEMHPLVAMMWMHPNPGSQSDAKIWIRALSHEPFPVGDQAPIETTRWAFDGTYNGGPPAQSGVPMITTFHLPGGPSATGERLYMQNVLTDWVLDPKLQSVAWGNSCDTGTTGCDLGIPDSSAQPWSNFGRQGSCANGPVTAADLVGNVTSYFNVNATDNHDGSITMSLSQVIGTERNEYELPVSVGAHFEVCYPACVNGLKTNSCPGICKPAAISNLAASLGGNYQGTRLVNLTWAAPNGAASSSVPASVYHIYRTTTPGAAFPSGYTQLSLYSDSISGAFTFTDGVQPNTTFYYVVTADNTDSPPMEGPPSNIARITIPGG
jgi:secreted trypsin-like serine protease